MNLSKITTHGTSKLKYYPTNKVVLGHWNENKVASFISPVGLFIISIIQQCVGPVNVDYIDLEALNQYATNNLTGGVDYW